MDIRVVERFVIADSCYCFDSVYVRKQHVTLEELCANCFLTLVQRTKF